MAHTCGKYRMPSWVCRQRWMHMDVVETVFLFFFKKKKSNSRDGFLLQTDFGKTEAERYRSVTALYHEALRRCTLAPLVVQQSE